MLQPRIQVVVSYEQRSGLRRMARRHGVSTSDLVRSAIDQMLSSERSEEVDPFLAIVGEVDSGLSDLSTRHDEYLAQDEFEKWHRPAS